MRRITKLKLSRGRAAVALTLLLCLGAVVAWKLTHRHDPRLLGQWKANPAPTFVINIYAEWEFLSDGTGERSGKLRPADESGLALNPTPVPQQPSTGIVSKPRAGVVHMRGRFRWWTRGDRLYVQMLTSKTLWMRIRNTAQDVFSSITGQPVMHVNYPIWEYQFVVEENDRIRITPESVPAPADSNVFQLTRLAGQAP